MEHLMDHVSCESSKKSTVTLKNKPKRFKDPFRKLLILRILNKALKSGYLLEEDEYLLNFEKDALSRTNHTRKIVFSLFFSPLLCYSGILYSSVFFSSIIGGYCIMNRHFFNYAKSLNTIMTIIERIKKSLNSSINFLKNIEAFKKRKVFLSKREIQLDFVLEIFISLENVITGHFTELIERLKVLRKILQQSKSCSQKCGKTLTDISVQDLLPECDSLKDLKENLELLEYLNSEYIRYCSLILINFDELYKKERLSLAQDMRNFTKIDLMCDSLLFQVESLKNASTWKDKRLQESSQVILMENVEGKILAETLNNLIIANDLTYQQLKTFKENQGSIDEDQLVLIEGFLESSRQLILSLQDERNIECRGDEKVIDLLSSDQLRQLNQPYESNAKIHRPEDLDPIEDDILIALPCEESNEPSFNTLGDELEENKQFQYGQRSVMHELKLSIAQRRDVHRDREKKVIEKKSKVNPTFAEEIKHFDILSEGFDIQEGNEKLEDFFSSTSMSESIISEPVRNRTKKPNISRRSLGKIMDRKMALMKLNVGEKEEKPEPLVEITPKIPSLPPDREFKNELMQSLLLRRQQMNEETFQ